MGEIKISKRKTLLYIILALLALILPLIFRNEYIYSVLISIILWAAISSSFDLTAGFIKVTNFGYAGFFAAGAYTSGLLALYYGVSPWIGLMLGTIVASALAAAVGFLTLRLHGIFAAAFSWFIAETLKYTLAALTDITRGYHGLACPPFFPGISRLPYYYMILFVYIAELIIMMRIINGKMGFAFKVIGEDETAARTIGVNVTFYRVLCFVISCAFAGFLGVFYAHYYNVITPDVSSLSVTVPALAICYVGGRGSIWGSLPSAAIILMIFELLRPYEAIGVISFAHKYIVYGILLIIVMIWVQGGLAGAVKKLTEKYVKTTS
jgi:branched-chain amino acid transport system permease protein